MEFGPAVMSHRLDHRKTMFKHKDRLPLIKRSRHRSSEVELRKQTCASTTAARQQREHFLHDIPVDNNTDLRVARRTENSISTTAFTFPTCIDSELLAIKATLESNEQPLDVKLQALRNLSGLASGVTSNVDLIIQASLHTVLIPLILSSPELSLACISTLTIIGSSSAEHADNLVHAGVTSELTSLLNVTSISQTSENIALTRKALCFLIVITNDSTSSQQLVLEQGGLYILLAFLQSVSPHYLQNSPFQPLIAEHSLFDERMAACFMYNLFKNLTTLPEGFLESELGLKVVTLLYNFISLPDGYTIGESCRTLDSLTSITPSMTDLILRSTPQIGPRLVKLLGSENLDSSTRSTIVGILGNITIGTDASADMVLHWDIMSAVRPLLLPPTDESLRKEVCGYIANVVADNKREHIQAVIDNNLVPPLIKILDSDGVLTNTKREACWSMCNMLCNPEISLEQIKYLVSQGCLPPLANKMITSMDNGIVMISLEALANVLQAGEIERSKDESAGGKNKYAEYLEEAYAVGNINRLLSTSANGQIFTLSCQIIDGYFSDENDGQVQFVPDPLIRKNNSSGGRSTGADAPLTRKDHDEEMLLDEQQVTLEPAAKGGVFVFSSGKSLGNERFNF